MDCGPVLEVVVTSSHVGLHVVGTEDEPQALNALASLGLHLVHEAVDGVRGLDLQGVCLALKIRHEDLEGLLLLKHVFLCLKQFLKSQILETTFLVCGPPSSS